MGEGALRCVARAVAAGRPSRQLQGAPRVSLFHPTPDQSMATPSRCWPLVHAVPVPTDSPPAPTYLQNVPIMCTNNGDVKLPYGSAAYVGLGFSV